MKDGCLAGGGSRAGRAARDHSSLSESAATQHPLCGRFPPAPGELARVLRSAYPPANLFKASSQLLLI